VEVLGKMRSHFLRSCDCGRSHAEQASEFLVDVSSYLSWSKRDHYVVALQAPENELWSGLGFLGGRGRAFREFAVATISPPPRIRVQLPVAIIELWGRFSHDLKVMLWLQS
jgi:hypothetical protein